MKRKFNRAEHLRPIPPGSDDDKRINPRRADTESLHRQLEDQLWHKRANCYGRVRVYADLLGFALGRNAIARYSHRHRSTNGPPLELAA